MNTQRLRIMTAVVGAVLWHTSAVYAQYAPHYVKVTVPFEFSFGDNLFPAGDYTLACTPNRLELRDSRDHTLATVIQHSVQSLDHSSGPRLVFTTSAGVHGLWQVWTADSHYGYELAPPNAATILAKQRSQTSGQMQGGGGTK